MDILIHSLVISGWCLGFRTITDDGMVLYPIREYAEKQERFKFLLKPLILCVTCTASIHGLIIHSLMWGFSFEMIITIIFSAYLNSLGWLTLEKLFAE